MCLLASPLFPAPHPPSHARITRKMTASTSFIVSIVLLLTSALLAFVICSSPMSLLVQFSGVSDHDEGAGIDSPTTRIIVQLFLFVRIFCAFDPCQLVSACLGHVDAFLVIAHVLSILSAFVSGQ